jgi:hypothetical protein
VHRDVKPANILISGPPGKPHVFLTDFGLTKRLGSANEALTRDGGWVGTPDYVAPEQIQGHKVDRRADVYSLGCVLFEMLTGRVAYEHDSDMAKLWAHVSDPPPLPRTERPELVEAFDDIVSRATAKDPEDRFATAGALSTAVDHAVGEQEAERHRRAAAPIAPPDLALSATRDETFVGAPPALAGVASEPAAPPPAAAAPVPPPPPAPPPPRGGGAAGPVPGRGEPPAQKPPGRRGGSGGGGGGWIRSHALLLGIAALVVGAGVAALALGGSGSSTSSNAPPPVVGQRVSSSMGPIPTNRVNGSGDAVMRLNGRSLKISIDTKGLLNGAPHALHIHAGGRGICPPASAASPHNGHLSIATHAGVPFYGPAVEALTTRGDTTLKSLVAFNRYPTTTDVRYRRTITVTPIVASYIRKNNAVLIAHGIDYNHNGVYDGVLERSDLDRSLTGESTAPALCGPLVAAKKAADKGAKTAQNNAGGTVYTVALAAQPTAPPDPIAVLCPLLAAKETRFPHA